MAAPKEKLVKPRHRLMTLSLRRGVARCSCGAVFVGETGISQRAQGDILLDIYSLHRKAMRKLARKS